MDQQYWVLFGQLLKRKEQLRVSIFVEMKQKNPNWIAEHGEILDLLKKAKNADSEYQRILKEMRNLKC